MIISVNAWPIVILVLIVLVVCVAFGGIATTDFAVPPNSAILTLTAMGPQATRSALSAAHEATTSALIATQVAVAVQQTAIAEAQTDAMRQTAQAEQQNDSAAPAANAAGMLGAFSANDLLWALILITGMGLLAGITLLALIITRQRQQDAQTRLIAEQRRLLELQASLNGSVTGKYSGPRRMR